MSAERTLARIDATLDDYEWDGHSPDAARWAGEPAEGEWPEPGDFYLDMLRRHQQRAMVGAEHAEQHVHFTVIPETSQLAEAWRRIAEAVIHLGVELDFIKRQAEAETGKSWAYLVQRSERPLAAAERTSSPRRRAGTRRTKRQARRRG